MTTAADDQVGETVLGRYRLVMPLAKGGQGVIYLAMGVGAAGFRLPVVIKRVLAPIARDPNANERFVREARITAQLRHPDIVSILDFERESDDSYVMVLEYVHGYDLSKWRTFVRKRGRPFDAQLAAYVTMRTLEALHYSHSMRASNGTPMPIIHRDISPGNVLIDDQGQVKLTDFGIAHSRLHEQEESSSSTQVELRGKLAYLSPELYRGAVPSPQSDIYACAVMLHQLLLGENEFQAKNLVSAALRVATHVPTPVCEVREDVSKAASDVIERALAKDPNLRQRTAREFAAELRRAFELDLGEMPERLAQAVRSDFFDPEFASTTQVIELSAIDRALEQVPTGRPSDAPTEPPLSNSQPSVLDARPSSDDKRASWWYVAAAALSLVFAAVFFMTRDAPQDRLVFVSSKQAPAPVSAADTQAPAREPAAAAPEPASAAVRAPVAAAVEPATKPKPDGISALTRAFAKRRREIEACFSRYSEGLSGAPRMYVAFEVERSGAVRTSALDPPSLGATPLGRCVLQVAGSTRFDKQASALRFRIPLTAHGQSGS